MMVALFRFLLAPGETRAFGALFLLSFQFFSRLAAVFVERVEELLSVDVLVSLASTRD